MWLDIESFNGQTFGNTADLIDVVNLASKSIRRRLLVFAQTCDSSSVINSTVGSKGRASVERSLDQGNKDGSKKEVTRDLPTAT